ncbi:MAG: hotdog fold thioesterase [Bacteroidia bacterium]|nr:hotdog fold thioesterase [Bacteroidia bacterium]
MIWHQPVSIENLNAFGIVNMMKHLGIEFTDIGDDFISARMPVDSRTQQPMGLLHGGASVALAETLGSTAANLCLDPSRHYALGLEINANHIKGVTNGYVYGTTRPVHIGKSTHIWSIEIKDDNNRIICISRITMAIRTRWTD